MKKILLGLLVVASLNASECSVWFGQFSDKYDEFSKTIRNGDVILAEAYLVPLGYLKDKVVLHCEPGYKVAATVEAVDIATRLVDAKKELLELQK